MVKTIRTTYQGIHIISDHASSANVYLDTLTPQPYCELLVILGTVTLAIIYTIKDRISESWDQARPLQLHGRVGPISKTFNTTFLKTPPLHWKKRNDNLRPAWPGLITPSNHSSDYLELRAQIESTWSIWTSLSPRSSNTTATKMISARIVLIWLIWRREFRIRYVH